MDRSFEQIRSEVLELDRESQRRLVEEVEEKLSETETEFDEEWRQEIKRRMDEYRRGEGTSVTAEELIANARRQIEEAKRAHGWA
jgi:putative addiction module component (TIGR02574 family)